MKKKGVIVLKQIPWHCHCCTASNDSDLKKCRVCGRDESYALDGYPLPLHGIGAKLFRPSQITNIMTEGGLYEKDSADWTALHSACVSGNAPTVLELLNLGSIVDAISDKGQTPLHVASYAGSVDIVAILVDRGANLNAQTSFEKMTPLHIACQRNWKAIAKYLIDRGAEVDALNIIERTPLHFAAAAGRTDLGVVLLKAGAKSNPMDIHGWTPRQVAELHNHREFQEFLVQANMPEKQPVIKVLPKAPWHGPLWDSLINTNMEKSLEAEKEKHRLESVSVEVRLAIRRQRDREAREREHESLTALFDAESRASTLSMGSSLTVAGQSDISGDAMSSERSNSSNYVAVAGVQRASISGAVGASARSKLAAAAGRNLNSIK